MGGNSLHAIKTVRLRTPQTPWKEDRRQKETEALVPLQDQGLFGVSSTTSFLFCVKSHFLLFSHSVVSNCFAIQWTVVHQALLSTGFSRQEYWNGLPFPSPGDHPNPAIEPASPELEG